MVNLLGKRSKSLIRRGRFCGDFSECVLILLDYRADFDSARLRSVGSGHSGRASGALQSSILSPARYSENVDLANIRVGTPLQVQLALLRFVRARPIGTTVGARKSVSLGKLARIVSAT
jgi:hypothetical protein